MALKIAFFDSHSYDETSFAATNADYGFDIQYYKEHLSLKTVPLAKGADVVCIFVNAECNAQVIDKLVEYGVKLIATNNTFYLHKKDNLQKFYSV